MDEEWRSEDEIELGISEDGQCEGRNAGGRWELGSGILVALPAPRNSETY